MLADGRDLAVALYGAERGATMTPAAYLETFGYAPPPADLVDADAAPLTASLVHGLWIARCDCGAPGVPHPGGVVFFDTPIVWCPRCENAAAGGGWRRVRVPPGAERAAIEAICDLRPSDEHRNWSPGETPAALAADNVAHGIEVT